MKTPKVKLIEWFDDRFYKIEYMENDVMKTDYFPSTTTKLGIVAKPFLARWRGDIGNREADMRLFEAQEKGKRIHHGWYTLTTGGIAVYQPFQRPNYTQDQLTALETEYSGNIAIFRYQDEFYDLLKLSKWLEIVKPKIIASEMIVYSLKNRDAGTTDNIFEIEEGEYLVNGSKPLKIDHGRYIVDLKSGSTVDDLSRPQTACYAKSHEEMGLGEINGTLILHTQAKTRTGIEGLATLLRKKDEVEQDYQDYRLISALWERKNANAKPDVFEFPTLLTLKGKNGQETE